MAEKCERLDECRFFKNFKHVYEESVQTWISLYCDDKSKARSCKRRQFFEKTGASPPDNMTPTGKIFEF